MLPKIDGAHLKPARRLHKIVMGPIRGQTCFCMCVCVCVGACVHVHVDIYVYTNLRVRAIFANMVIFTGFIFKFRSGFILGFTLGFT